MSMLKKTSKSVDESEFTRMSELVDATRSRRRQCLSYANRVIARLKIYGQDTDNHAMFLARVGNELDSVYGLGGGQLCLEWMLDYYMAMEFERAYPWLVAIWKYLVDNEYDQKNKYEYFNDAEAFYVEAERMICVLGKRYGQRYLVIDDRKPDDHVFSHKCYVRHIWPRTKFDCIGGVARPVLRHYSSLNFKMGFSDGPLRVYGDARDQGHVLTYEKILGKATCDKVIWDVNAPILFFFEVNTLWTQAIGIADESVEG